MHVLGLILILLICVSFVAAAASIPFSVKYEKGWQRLLGVVASCFLAIGAVGFLGPGIAACGGLNWLPNSVEWPVGYAEGVITTPEGLHVVPQEFYDRVQIYDANWSFVIGWHVEFGKGKPTLVASTNKYIEVITTHEDWHYVFDMEGHLISKDSYSYLPESYYPLSGKSEKLFVPTSLWLLSFSQPMFAWVAAAIGGAILLVLEMLKPEYSKEEEKTTNSLSSTPS